jgi:hypothetical protein
LSEEKKGAQVQKTWEQRFDEAIPHSAVRVWERLWNKDAKKMLPGLRFLKEKAWVIIVVLVIGGLFAGIFGTLVTIEATNKPTQLWDVCTPPAQLTTNGAGQPNGCVLHTVTSQTINGAVQVKNVTLPAGSLYYFNGTRLGG